MSQGRPIPVTSAGSFSRLITRIDVRIDTDFKDMIAIILQNTLVDRRTVVPVAQIGAIVAGYNQIVASGGDGFTVFNAGTDQLGGDVDLDALAELFRRAFAGGAGRAGPHRQSRRCA
jgi:hypothetical protein